MGAPDGSHAGLREAEVPHLALADQLLHRSGDVLDRRVRVDAMLVEEVDVFGLESLQAPVDRDLDVLGAAVYAAVLLPVSGSTSQPNLVPITTSPRKGASASPTSSSFVNGP